MGLRHPWRDEGPAVAPEAEEPEDGALLLFAEWPFPASGEARGNAAPFAITGFLEHLIKANQ